MGLGLTMPSPHDPTQVPIREDHPLHALNPYGSTKVVMEGVMADTAKAGRWAS